MSIYLVIYNDNYISVPYPPNHDHWKYDEASDIYYETAPYHQYTDNMLNTLKEYGVQYLP